MALATTDTEDGFTAAPERGIDAAATLARYHSADTNTDGRIALAEMLEVIHLYNYRVGTVRTGDYRHDPAVPEGFATGP